MIFDRIRNLALLCAVALVGCKDPGTPPRAYHAIDGFTMGTTWSLKYEGSTDPKDIRSLRRRLVDRLDELEKQMSTWREDSQISRFNASNSTNWFPVSTDVVRVVASAQNVSEKTDGAFDVTAYPLIRMWGFGGESAPESIPEREAIEAALESVGYHKLNHRLQPPGLRKLVAGLQIDVSAIAKGFAVDQLAELMMEQGTTNYLVEIGGEIRSLGQRENGGPWRVGIEDPVVGESRIEEVLPLLAKALASSGDYRNFIEIDDQKFAHIVDPRTGHPLPQRDLAVSVVAGDCMFADAWATAFTVLGPEKGLEVAHANGLAVMFRFREDRNIRVAVSESWPIKPRPK